MLLENKIIICWLRLNHCTKQVVGEGEKYKNDLLTMLLLLWDLLGDLPSTQIVSSNFCVRNFSRFHFLFWWLLTYHHHHLVGSQSILVFLMFWRARETRREKKKGIQIPPTWCGRPQQAQRKVQNWKKWKNYYHG
jgi:hypothetical protein